MIDHEEKALEEDMTSQNAEQVAEQSTAESVEETSVEATESVAYDSEDAAEENAKAADVATSSVEDKPKEEVAPPKVYATKAEIVQRLKEISASNDTPDKAELDRLKAQFYKLHLAQREAEMKEFVDGGGDPNAFQILPDDEEELFKSEMSIIRDKREAIRKQQEEERKANLEKKQSIIERIKALATSPDEANKGYQEFKSLQQQWKEIKNVPAEAVTELWRNYQHCREQYYDLLKLNHEAREYDFRKNLEIKTHLCEMAEHLADEPDVLSAFGQLQELHTQYRETGPVAKEQREAIWARFKAASTVVNKRHQQYYDDLRSNETDNLARKTELCEKAEALAEKVCKTMSEWEESTKQMLDLQQQWRTIGFATQKMNAKIYERFHATCDKFFSMRSDFFKEIKQAYAQNIEKKRALIEKAKALQDSTEWRSTGDKLIALQKEWRTIGFVPRKQGDKLWAEFREACNKFFDARKSATSDTRSQERENMAKKRDVIARIRQVAEQAPEDGRKQLQQLSEEFAKIGHVPYRDKETLYQEYREALDEAYSKIPNSGSNSSAGQSHRNDDIDDGDRPRLMRRYEQLKQEVMTYENNLGFFSGSSKKANSLVEEVNRKIQRLKEDIEQIRLKIKAIDEQGNA